MKKFLIFTLVLLIIPAISLATDDVTFSTDTNLTVNGYTIVVRSGSICDQIVVNSTNVQITLSANSSMVLTSADKVNFNLDDSSFGSTACLINESSINLIAPSTASTVTITPSGTCEGSSASPARTRTRTRERGSETNTGEATVDCSKGGKATITNSDDTTASVDLPDGAVSDSTDVKITPTAKETAISSRPAPSERSLVGSYVYDLSATANQAKVSSFKKAVSLIFSYTDEQIKGLNELSLKIFYWDENNNKWTALASSVDAQNNIITAETNHFTYFAIFGSEDEGIETTPSEAVSETSIVDGDLMRNPSADGLAKYDVYIAKIVGAKKFKRLILSPHVFDSYGHLSWSSIKDVDQATLNSYTTSDLVRCMDPDFGVDDPKVYRMIADGDTGTKQHMNMTAAEFEAAGNDWASIYIINKTDRDAYTTSSSSN